MKIYENAAVETRFHGRKRVRVAEPAVQDDDGVGTMAHAVIGIVHMHPCRKSLHGSGTGGGPRAMPGQIL
jgi:hypothetical protein